jgi:hypothetical protein
VQVTADRLDFIPGQIPRDSLVSAVFLRVIHHCLLMSLLWHPSLWHLFSMSWHDLQCSLITLKRLSSTGDFD